MATQLHDVTVLSRFEAKLVRILEQHSHMWRVRGDALEAEVGVTDCKGNFWSEWHEVGNMTIPELYTWLGY